MSFKTNLMIVQFSPISESQQFKKMVKDKSKGIRISVQLTYCSKARFRVIFY